jgi:hypothetical protein
LQLLKQLYATEEFRGMNLESFLLKPIQRLCKYPLFLRQLIKCSYPEEILALEKALAKLEMIVNVVNERTKQVENAERTLNACMKINFREPIDLLTPSRTLVLDYTFDCSYSSSGLVKRRLFLFTDILLITKDIFKGKYDCTSLFPLSMIKAEPVDPSYFKLILPNDEMFVYCDTLMMRDLWLNKIKDCDANTSDFQKYIVWPDVEFNKMKMYKETYE